MVIHTCRSDNGWFIPPIFKLQVINTENNWRDAWYGLKSLYRNYYLFLSSDMSLT